uniref:VPS37A subunit of ESCRT-I n=2 Tax=Ornithorhynchus anatinus TaxID=9258 RepID=A0A6I8MXW0_ORNAN
MTRHAARRGGGRREREGGGGGGGGGGACALPGGSSRAWAWAWSCRVRPCVGPFASPGPGRMSWLFPLAKSGSSPAPGGLTSLQQQRQRLIDSLRAAHARLLPPQFPQEKPVISVYPPIRHHLVDSHGVYISCPLLKNFTMHSDLGKIIQSLLDEFWKNPPVLAPSSTTFPYLYSNPAGMAPFAPQGFPFVPPYPPPEANRPVTSGPAPDPAADPAPPAKPAVPTFAVLSQLPLPVPMADSAAQVGQNGSGYKMPDVPDAFPELSELSLSQLSDMNEQEEILLEQFVNLPYLKAVITDKDSLVKSIEELARKNLLLEPNLETKRQAVLDKYTLLMQMKSAFEKKMQRQHELSESCSASALQARLKVAAREAEEESDTIAEDFLEGKTEIDDFLSSFMEKRTVCHCRRAKEEKLQQAMAALPGQLHAPL